MLAQIVGTFGLAAAGEIGGAADDDEAKRRRQPHRDHVGGDELAHPDAGVKPARREVDQFFAGGDLHLDLGIGLAERCDQRLQHDRHHRARHRQAQQSGRPLPEITRDLARGDQLLEGGLGARQEAFAGFGQADTARGADEERRADARLERAYRLADRRGRHPEFARPPCENCGAGQRSGTPPRRRARLAGL